MRYLTFGLIILVGAFGSAAAQQPNLTFSALNFNGAASAAVTAPATLSQLTDSSFSINVKGFPGVNPVVILFGTSAQAGGSLNIGAFQGFNFQLDIADVVQPPGTHFPGYLDQILVDGYNAPSPNSFTDATGNLAITGLVPACTVHPTAINCISIPSFEVSVQALVVDPTNAPFNIRSTGAGVVSFTNGYKRFNNLVADNFDFFDFLAGFSFRYYGQTYTRAFVSSNGYVSFQTPSTAFPNPMVGEILSGVPRIMHFYNDLEPEVNTFNGRVYAQQFQDTNGVRKIKFVHERLQEWGNPQGGPHGGETIITENDDVSIYLPGYNTMPSINTAVGLTPGMGVDTAGNLPTPFGRDLSADFNSPSGNATGPGHSAFELYDHGSAPASNAIDIIAIGLVNGSPVGPGIVFSPDPTLPNTTPGNSGYIVM